MTERAKPSPRAHFSVFYPLNSRWADNDIYGHINNVAYYAYNGSGVEAFEGKPIENLRGVAVLYPETIQVLARKDADIKTLADMKGKRVYVGDIGSGSEGFFACSSQDHDPHFRIIVESVQGITQFTDHLVVNCIASLGTIEGQSSNVNAFVFEAIEVNCFVTHRLCR